MADEPNRAPVVEIGREGLESFAGRTTEAYIAKLQWPGAYAVYDQMRRRDPTLRSMLNAVRFLARQAEWKAEGASDKGADRDASEFLDSCLGDMSHTVGDLLDDILTMMPFGWSSVEICYKRREGRGGAHPSLLDDGRIGWRKLAYRRQSSWDHWLFDESGGMAGWVQRAAPDYQDRTLPIEKLIHFVAERDGGNPAGIALFESAYEPFHFVTNLQVVGGIGWQRAFVGLPVFELEAGSNPQASDLTTIQNVGQGLVVDERQYVSVPPGVRFRLESTENSGADALLSTIKYYRTLMLMIALADFISLGTTERGSWALGSDKSDLFLMAVNGYLDRIAETWTRFGVARLFDYNEFRGMAGLPRIVHSPIYKPNLPGLGAFISQIAQYIQIGDDDRAWIRQQAGMPERSAGEPLVPDPSRSTGEAGDGEQGLAEFAEFDGAGDVRSKAERVLAGQVKAELDECAARVMDEVQAGRDVAGNAQFWATERETLGRRLLAAWTDLAGELLRAAVLDVENGLATGADWTMVNARAAAWAREFVGDEITRITDATRTAVRESVANWIQAGQELPDLGKALTPTFGKARAELIAATEVTRAFSEMNNLTWQEIGLPAMAMTSPAHPGCRCWQRPVMLSNGEWVVVWATARDERVCSRPVAAPWGTVAGCGALDGRIVSEGKYLGKRLDEVQ